MRYIRNTYHDDTIVKVNQRVDIGVTLNVRHMVFSNNDLHLCVLGDKEIVIIEVRSGFKRGYSLPSLRRLYAGVSQDDPNAGPPLGTDSTERNQNEKTSRAGDTHQSSINKNDSVQRNIKVVENDLLHPSTSEKMRDNSRISDMDQLHDKSAAMSDDPNASTSV